MNKHPSSTPAKNQQPAPSPRRTPQTHSVHKEKSPARPVLSAPEFGAGPQTATAALTLAPVRIGYFRPEAREVYLAGSFNGWDPREIPLQRDSFGDWSVELSLPPGEHRYRLLVDGEWRDDPSAQRLEPNPFGGFDAVLVV